VSYLSPALYSRWIWHVTKTSSDSPHINTGLGGLLTTRKVNSLLKKSREEVMGQQLLAQLLASHHQRHNRKQRSSILLALPMLRQASSQMVGILLPHWWAMPFKRQDRASPTKKKGGVRTCSSSLLTRRKIRKLYFGGDNVCLLSCVLFFLYNSPLFLLVA
jgi:hypothetical protein